MFRLKAKQKLQVAIAMLFASIVAYASADGPEPGYTNAPNDLGNCTACHDKHLVDTGTGNVRINGLPAVYQPGQTYTFTVTTSQANRIRFGFQLTALDMLSKRAGTLATMDGNTQLLGQTGVGGRQYIEHTNQGTLSAVLGSRTWQLRWTAPATDIGVVRFYAAGNATNNSGVQDDDDWIYTTSALVDSPTTLVTVSLDTRPDGEILQAGSVFSIGWSTTNPSNIDNTELRYSTDDGATFPIANQIFFTTDPAITSHDWTVPNNPTTKARFRLRIGKKSGDAVEVITDVFTIAGDGSVVPTILNAAVSGKKLLVSGLDFGDGAALYMCSDDCTEPATQGNKVKKVTNDEEMPATLLRAKKAGKDIAHGSTVILQVKNPDGALSDPFSFTRPE
ncbi:MAG TPA: choice-of-anchor V domain-containing protein [Blastocatellia bacterium]|nr:choice-of-anchor V domain-containing protein [Blastocatellia bacterium]